MDLKEEKNQHKFKDELFRKITTPDTKVELNLREYDKDEDLHNILSESFPVNWLMLAINCNNEEILYEILDILHLGATHYRFWTEGDFVDFLCKTDNDGNNVLQLALIHQRDKQSNLLPKTLLKYAACNKSKLAKLVDHLNDQRKSSVDLAFEKEWDEDLLKYLLDKSNLTEDKKNNFVKKIKTFDKKGMMRATIVYDDVEDNKRNARSLDEAFRGRGFYVNHWQHVEWNADNLCQKLEQSCQEQNVTEQLWVLCLTHGKYKRILDSSGNEIKIDDITESITKASNVDTEVIPFHI